MVRTRNYNSKQVTSVSEPTLHPVWNETFKYNVMAYQNFVFELYDQDRFSKDDLNTMECVVEYISKKIKRL